MKYMYILDTTSVLDEYGSMFITYGITAVTYDGKVLLSIPDISLDLQKTRHFVDLCNSLELSLCHIYDAIDDFLIDQLLV